MQRADHSHEKGLICYHLKNALQCGFHLNATNSLCSDVVDGTLMRTSIIAGVELIAVIWSHFHSWSNHTMSKVKQVEYDLNHSIFLSVTSQGFVGDKLAFWWT